GSQSATCCSAPPPSCRRSATSGSSRSSRSRFRAMGMMIPLLAFLFGTALVGGIAYVMIPSSADVIDRRLEELTLAPDVEEKPRFQAVVGVLKRIGERAPKSPKEMGSLRLRLVQAGYRRDEALTIFFGIRVAFALLLFAAFSTGFFAR